MSISLWNSDLNSQKAAILYAWSREASQRYITRFIRYCYFVSSFLVVFHFYHPFYCVNYIVLSSTICFFDWIVGSRGRWALNGICHDHYCVCESIWAHSEFKVFYLHLSDVFLELELSRIFQIIFNLRCWKKVMMLWLPAYAFWAFDFERMKNRCEIGYCAGKKIFECWI